MDKLTALRTFGNSSLTPAKRVKIFNDRWYEVVMQNTERDMGDGYYLAEGTYTELLPGKAARERREARLNHCNAIAEYTGGVIELFVNEYGGEVRSVGYFRNATETKEALEKAKAAHNKWVTDCIEESLKAEKQALAAEGDAEATGTFVEGRYTGGKTSAAVYWERAEDILKRTAERSNKFRADFKVIR